MANSIHDPIEIDPGSEIPIVSVGLIPSFRAGEGTGPAYTGGYADEVEAGSFLDYWNLLSRRKGTLTALCLCGTLAGLFFALFQSPIYQAHTTIEIEDVNREFLNMKQMNPVDDSSITNGAADLQTQLRILQSETLIDQALNRLKISSLSALNPKTGSFAGRGGQEVPLSRNQLIAAASKLLKVSVPGQTRLIEISFQSADPKVASGFANSLAAEYIDRHMLERGQLNQHTAGWLNQQLSDLRANLQRSDDALQAYARQNGLVYTGDKENFSTEKLRQMQEQVSQAQGDLAQKESRFKTANSAAADTLADVLNDASLRALRNKITELRSQEATLATNFKPEYSKAKQTRAEITALESALEKERADVVTRITNDYVEAEHREAQLSSAYNNQVKLVMKDSQRSIGYDMLKREVDTNRQIYEAMLRQVKESSIASALKASNIRIIDEARTPEKPFKPSLPLDTAGGLLAGLGAALATIVIGRQANRKLNQPGEAGRLLGLPELGVVPRVETAARFRLPAITGVARRERRETKSEQNGPLALWQGKSTLVADSFRSVLASIIFSHGKNVKGVLVVTSAGPNEGKTTTSANLSIALANIGHRVLLIDGDIRKPSIHKVFGLPNETGLTNLMNQVLLEEAAAEAAIRTTDFPNLQVLTSGPALQIGCDLLFTASMPRLIGYFKDRFDMIVIDTPPLLHMPDARVLSRMADSVVLVARAGSTLRDAAVAACERLSQDRTTILGVVLNDWNPKSAPNGYYGNYSAAITKKYHSAL